MGDKGGKGREMLAQAEAKLKGWSFFNKSGKYEEAADLYANAANAFKMDKMFREAGEAYLEAASMQSRLNSRNELAGTYVDASKCFKKVDPEKAIKCLSKAVDVFRDMRRQNIAAKHKVAIAEIYENEVADLKQAMLHYEEAADWYETEDSPSAANKCLLKVALFAADLEDYGRAVQIYEKVADGSIDNSLLKWSVKEYYLRAGLCHMASKASGAEVARQRVEEYMDKYAPFRDSRECKLLLNLLDALDEQDVEEFTNIVADYDSVGRLDPWYTKLLLRIKKSINEESLR